MSNFIDRIFDKTGKFISSFSGEAANVMGTGNYQIWLMLSLVAVVVGFVFLRSGRV